MKCFSQLLRLWCNSHTARRNCLRPNKTRFDRTIVELLQLQCDKSLSAHFVRSEMLIGCYAQLSVIMSRILLKLFFSIIARSFKRSGRRQWVFKEATSVIIRFIKSTSACSLGWWRRLCLRNIARHLGIVSILPKLLPLLQGSIACGEISGFKRMGYMGVGKLRHLLVLHQWRKRSARCLLHKSNFSFDANGNWRHGAKQQQGWLATSKQQQFC